MLRHVGENPSASDVAVLAIVITSIFVIITVINIVIMIIINLMNFIFMMIMIMQEMAVEVDIGQTGSFIFPNFLELIQRLTVNSGNI